MVIKAIVVSVAVALVIIGILSFTPLPGRYNVEVTVDSYELPLVLATDFGITSVTGQNIGQSTVIDWAVAGIAPFAIDATFTMTVCVGSTCTSESSNTWFPSVPIIDGQSITATNTFKIGYVPGGEATISVTLTQSGSTVATGSGSIDVGS